MRKISILFVLAMLCININAFSQNSKRSNGKDSSYRGLYIGDTIPVFTTEKVFNYSRKSLSLSDFRGKTVILDFWHTYCSSCLIKFPEEDSLQRIYNKELQFLLVDSRSSRDDLARIKYTLSIFDKPINLPTIYDDSILSTHFPCYSNPHYVWLNKQGVVIAITGGEAVTPENISLAIKNDNIDLPVTNLGILHADWLLPVSENEEFSGRTLYGDLVSNTGEPISDADMKCLTSLSTSGTNNKGRFMIAQHTEKEILRINSAGFKTAYMKITSKTVLPLHIVMQRLSSKNKK